MNISCGSPEGFILIQVRNKFQRINIICSKCDQSLDDVAVSMTQRRCESSGQHISLGYSMFKCIQQPYLYRKKNHRNSPYPGSLINFVGEKEQAFSFRTQFTTSQLYTQMLILAAYVVKPKCKLRINIIKLRLNCWYKLYRIITLKYVFSKQRQYMNCD